MIRVLREIVGWLLMLTVYEAPLSVLESTAFVFLRKEYDSSMLVSNTELRLRFLGG